MDKVTALEQWRESPVYTDQERVALAYAEAMTYPDQHIDDQLKQQVTEHFSEKQIIELTALISFQNMSSNVNGAMDVQPQGFCQTGA